MACVVGRLGRVGQADYAVANEVLNKVAQAEARRDKGAEAVRVALEMARLRRELADRWR